VYVVYVWALANIDTECVVIIHEHFLTYWCMVHGNS